MDRFLLRGPLKSTAGKAKRGSPGREEDDAGPVEEGGGTAAKRPRRDTASSGHWRHIRAEGLSCDYKILFGRAEADAIFRELEKGAHPAACLWEVAQHPTEAGDLRRRWADLHVFGCHLLPQAVDPGAGAYPGPPPPGHWAQLQLCSDQQVQGRAGSHGGASRRRARTGPPQPHRVRVLWRRQRLHLPALHFPRQGALVPDRARQAATGARQPPPDELPHQPVLDPQPAQPEEGAGPASQPDVSEGAGALRGAVGHGGVS